MGETRLPTPIKVDALRKLLRNYEGRDYLVQGFQFGFNVHFEGIDKPLDSDNAKNALDNPYIVWEKLKREMKMGRIAGPYESPPFENFKCSPLNIREKSEKGKFRLIHNLSYPYDDRAVNFNIPKEYGTVKYDNLEDAVQLINNKGPNAWIAKTDIADAFFLIPINPNCYKYMGFQWEEKFYYYKVLPMGCKSSCAIFSAFSDAIRWLIITKMGNAGIVKVLDDFLFVGISETECNDQLIMFKEFCLELGIPIAEHKTVEACQKLIFLGIEIDTKKMVATLPIEKIQRYSTRISETLNRRKITLSELKSLLGILQYATAVIKGGRAFLRRMYDLTKNITHSHYKITLTRQVKADLHIWKRFLELYNGVTIIRDMPSINSDTINLFTDASLDGFGGTYGTNYITGKFPSSWKDYSIVVLETYPILALIVTFGLKLKNSKVVFNCDNQGVVSIINSQTSRNPLIMVMIRKLVLTLLINNIKFSARHIPGKSNTICDILSRKQVPEAMLRQWGLKPSPTVVPVEIRPENVILE